MVDPSKKLCIYCATEKPLDEFSLEHVVPQFLGGTQMPDEFKTRDVCATCNNNLGLFVDAAFEKDFLVFNQLTQIAHDLFDPTKPEGLPLRCMGPSDLNPPGMLDDEVCELWLGSLGEQIYWIRPKDDRLYWYSGGNPRTVKKVRTTAYFMASKRSLKNPVLTWLSFRDSFAGRRVRKVMGTVWEGADPSSIGFSDPNEEESEVLAYLKEMCFSGAIRKQSLSMYVDYEKRFMAKLALGVSHVLFGPAVQTNDYIHELRKGLWFKQGDPMPSIYGQSALNDEKELLKAFLGVRSGVVISLVPMPKGVVLNLNIRQEMCWTIVCARLNDLSKNQIEALGEGQCFVIYRPISKVVRLTLPELVAHGSGSFIHSEIASVEAASGEYHDYFKNL